MIVCSVDTEMPLVALTFDDGPDEVDTRALLDVLEELDARATFFVQGSRLSANAADLVRRMASAGHDVGNHTHRHLDLSRQPDSVVRDQILRTHARIETIVGRSPDLVRPPFGAGAETVERVVAPLGYRAVVLWSAVASDWTTPQPSSDEIVARIVAGHGDCRPLAPGGIVLLHDGGADRSKGESRRATVEATRQLALRLRDDGYRLATVSDLLDAATDRS